MNETLPPASETEPETTPGVAAAAAGSKVTKRGVGRLVDSTQADDRRMICLVRERPLLYARSNLPVASYHSQVKKLWREVADIMGWTGTYIFYLATGFIGNRDASKVGRYLLCTDINSVLLWCY